MGEQPIFPRFVILKLDFINIYILINIQQITDTSIVKDILVLRPLTTAPDDSVVNLAFANQCASLKEILIEDANDRSIHLLSDAICLHFFPP